MKTFFRTLGIGALAGFFTPLLLLMFILSFGLDFGDIPQLVIIFSTVCIVLGTLGALIGWYRGNTQRAMWVGGLIGGVIAVPVIVIIFVVYGELLSALFGQ